MRSLHDETFSRFQSKLAVKIIDKKFSIIFFFQISCICHNYGFQTLNYFTIYYMLRFIKMFKYYIEFLRSVGSGFNDFGQQQRIRLQLLWNKNHDDNLWPTTLVGLKM